MTLRPATASVLAESPSVRMSVQSMEFLVPASLASSSLLTPLSLLVFLLVCAFFMSRSCLNLDHASTLSTIPD